MNECQTDLFGPLDQGDLIRTRRLIGDIYGERKRDSIDR